MKKHNLRTQNSVPSAGFTLIEILVVIAIIGILASIAGIMLGGARDKARAASAMSSMKAMITEAALHQDSNGKYPATLCYGYQLSGTFKYGFVGEPLKKLADAVLEQTGGETSWATPICVTEVMTEGQQPQKWAVSVDLNREEGVEDFFCVDSSGFSGSNKIIDGFSNTGECIINPFP